MPWGGNGNDGFTLANIPKGWIVSDESRDASDFQMLASMIGEHMVEIWRRISNIEGYLHS